MESFQIVYGTEQLEWYIPDTMPSDSKKADLASVPSPSLISSQNLGTRTGGKKNIYQGSGTQSDFLEP